MRSLPGVDAVLGEMASVVSEYGHERVVEKIRYELSALRADLQVGGLCENPLRFLVARIPAALAADAQPLLRPVINLTGTVLHTNLGRAVMSKQAIEAMVDVAGQPTNLEFDLESGRRGERDCHIENLICELTGAEAATTVNNNAAAVLLVLNSLAYKQEVPVSRGELVEIGGSFRIPEVMERSGTKLIEVGATNRTHLRDYDRAIGEHTALLMKVHTSNYRVEGFTAAVEETELAELAHARDLPLVVDLGSGCLIDMTVYGLPGEPTVREILSTGVDLVTFSGDKLLGGPQCGVIAGRKDLIARIRSNPLKRALRTDKLTLAGLAATLRLYRNPQQLQQTLPTLAALTRTEAELQTLAESLLAAVADCIGDAYSVAVETCYSQIGSGALPVETLPSCALVISSATGVDAEVRRLQAHLRSLPKPVITRLHGGRVWMDLRCLENSEELVTQLQRLSVHSK